MGRSLASIPSLAIILFFAIPIRTALCQSCAGCVGAGGSGSGGSGGAMVSISVAVEGGKCKPVLGGDPPTAECAATRQCTRTVVRSWSGLAPGSAIEFCLTLDSTGTEWCIEPPPTTDTGSGSNTSTSPMPCGQSTTSSIAQGEHSATAGATCSECPD